ncbi:MAG: hypothetical protein WC530_02015 [Candidatus Omnitrophota bacterium]
METKKMSVKAFALAGGILWGSALLIVGLLNLASLGYGKSFLDAIGSVYLWHPSAASAGSVLVLACLGFLDGAIGGLLFAWLYNLCSCCCCKNRSE